MAWSTQYDAIHVVDKDTFLKAERSQWVHTHISFGTMVLHLSDAVTLSFFLILLSYIKTQTKFPLPSLPPPPSSPPDSLLLQLPSEKSRPPPEDINPTCHNTFIFSFMGSFHTSINEHTNSQSHQRCLGILFSLHAHKYLSFCLQWFCNHFQARHMSNQSLA